MSSIIDLFVFPISYNECGINIINIIIVELKEEDMPMVLLV